MVMATVVAVVVVMVVLRVLFDFSFIFGQTTLSFRILHVSTRSLTANYKYQPIQLATERKETSTTTKNEKEYLHIEK